MSVDLCMMNQFEAKRDIWLGKLPEFVHNGIFMYSAEDVVADYIAKYPL